MNNVIYYNMLINVFSIDSSDTSEEDDNVSIENSAFQKVFRCISNVLIYYDIKRKRFSLKHLHWQLVLLLQI